MAEITLDVSNTEIQELALEQSSDSDVVTFSVDGRVTEVDKEKVEEIMRAQRVNPVSLTVETE